MINSIWWSSYCKILISSYAKSGIVISSDLDQIGIGAGHVVDVGRRQVTITTTVTQYDSSSSTLYFFEFEVETGTVFEDLNQQGITNTCTDIGKGLDILTVTETGLGVR